MSASILYVIGSLEVGGAERHLVQVLPRLAHRGFRPVVYTLTHPGALGPRLESSGIAVLAPPGAARWPRAGRLERGARLLWACGHLYRTLRRHRPDVVHFFLPMAYLVGGLCAIAARCPHRVMSRRSLNRYQHRHPSLARLERWLHGRMDRLVGNSRAVVEELRAEGAPPARLRLLYNGVDVDDLRPVLARGEARFRLGLPQDAFVLLVVANLIPYKGHADLIDALGRVAGRLPRPWRLLCAGRDDGVRAGLESRARGLGIEDSVHFLGPREDVRELLRAADLAVLPSHEEGFSNTLLECMAAGLPVVATRVGGNAEAVVDGVTGLLVRAVDPVGLGEAITTLAADPGLRARMGRAAAQRARAKFSLESCVEGYAGLYQGLRAAPVRARVP